MKFKSSYVRRLAFVHDIFILSLMVVDLKGRARNYGSVQAICFECALIITVSVGLNEMSNAWGLKDHFDKFTFSQHSSSSCSTKKKDLFYYNTVKKLFPSLMTFFKLIRGLLTSSSTTPFAREFTWKKTNSEVRDRFFFKLFSYQC